MKKIISLAILVQMLFVTCICFAQDRPNVIIVITDDQGKNDLACLGNPYIKTPHLDNFHKDAVRFTNYHVSSTCAPSRGSLMAGRHKIKIVKKLC